MQSWNQLPQQDHQVKRQSPEQEQQLLGQLTKHNNNTWIDGSPWRRRLQAAQTTNTTCTEYTAGSTKCCITTGACVAGNCQGNGWKSVRVVWL